MAVEPGLRAGAFLLAASVALLVLFAITALLGWLLSRPIVRGRLERRREPLDPVAAANLVLRLLPEGGLEIGDGHYHAGSISWEVATPKVIGHETPRRCPATVRTLLRGDAVMLDLREGCMLKDKVKGIVINKVAFVHGRRVYGAKPHASPSERCLRLASARDWRALHRDLPRLLAQVSIAPNDTKA